MYTDDSLSAGMRRNDTLGLVNTSPDGGTVSNSLAGSASVEIQVEYNGVSSNKINLPVSRTAPGIFALDSSGSGQGAIQNQDYSVNGLSRPAAIGSIITIYATGGGRTNPQAPDGSLIGVPLPLVVETLTVKIDGQDADVLYAGMAPLQVNGVLQINARIPWSLKRGGSLPIDVTVGGTSAQSGVTVSVESPVE